MTRKVILHPEAETEILQALDWYAERSALAARAFVHELNGLCPKSLASKFLACEAGVSIKPGAQAPG